VRYSLGISWLILVAAEQVNATSGIGYLMNDARDFMRIDIMVVGLLIYALSGPGGRHPGSMAGTAPLGLAPIVRQRRGMSPRMVNVRGVSRLFGKTLALDNVDLVSIPASLSRFSAAAAPARAPC
jgi:hypothetical protein